MFSGFPDKKMIHSQDAPSQHIESGRGIEVDVFRISGQKMIYSQDAPSRQYSSTLSFRAPFFWREESLRCRMPRRAFKSKGCGHVRLTRAGKTSGILRGQRRAALNDRGTGRDRVLAGDFAMVAELIESGKVAEALR